MRKFLIPLLLASALAPAAAHADDGGLLRGLRQQAERGSRDDASEDRSSDNRPQRAHRVERSERADRPARIERVERADRPVRIDRIDRSDGEQRVERRIRRIERPAVEAEAVQEVHTAPPVRPERRIARDGLLGGALAPDGERQVERRRDGDNDRWRDRDGDRRWRDREGDGSRWRDHDGNGSRWRDRDGRHWRWSNDWRRDRRYDWSSYRNRYGSLFRLGRYYDPYRYGYRRFSIGFSLLPSYYSSRYWLDDPWQYRLPPAYGPYRWVRYYDDALLVDIYSGQVVDVIHNFFW